MLVSCVMPTCNRRAFIPAAIDCFQRQTWEQKELIIVDDGQDRVRDLIPKDQQIRYIEMPAKITTGCKRNLCNTEARGEIIIHFDDDDWSAPNRIEDQAMRLLKSGKQITGYYNMIYWDTILKKAIYYKGHIQNYVVGLSLCYFRRYWLNLQFPMLQVSSDGVFILSSLDEIAPCEEDGHIVARKHGNNVSDKSYIDKEIPIDRIPNAFWENETLRLTGLTESAKCQ